LQHGDKQASGASSKLGEKNTEVTEKKPASADVIQPPKTQSRGAPAAAKKQSPAVVAPSPQIKKPSETKPTPTTRMDPGKLNAESTQPTDSQNNKVPEERQKEASDGNSQASPSVSTASEANNTGEATPPPADEAPQVASTGGAKVQPEETPTTSAADTAPASALAAADEPNAELDMNMSALETLIDMLSGPEEGDTAGSLYTAPEVMDEICSRYLEELGKREGSLPPEYVRLLKKPMTDAQLVEALSSDFACASASAGGNTTLTENPPEEGEVMRAEAASEVKTSAPPEEQKTKSEEVIPESAVLALLDTVNGLESDLEEDPTPFVEVTEAKAEEKKVQKAGEHDDTIPPDYRLKPELDKDGKPILPKPEEKPKTWSESDLVDEFSKDFCPAEPGAQPEPLKPSSTSEKPSDPVPAKAAEEAAVPRATACSVQSGAPPAVSSVGPVADETVSSSLGEREPDPKENKPLVDKVKKQPGLKRKPKNLAEEEETIPPEYRLRGAKGEERKPLQPKPEVKSQPKSEDDILDLEYLAEEFSSSPSPAAPKEAKEGAVPAGSSQVISAVADSSVHLAAPPAPALGGKMMDEAVDLLSDLLGQREPDPDENKPLVDEVKEKAESEHRDKLGERDDTIPPEYKKLLESGQQGQPVKPAAEGDVKMKGEKHPADDSEAIAALSDDFGACQAVPATPKRPKDTKGTEASATKPTPKEKGKAKDQKKARGQSSGSKSEKEKTS
ncbi:ICAL protein, partial [Galbula dea]|nr:ICAL protein [Galbula dea]